MSGLAFENEVRTIARALWPGAPGAGASQIVDERERDCLFEEEFLTHYVEVTAFKSLDKVKRDVAKMVAFQKKAQKKNRQVKLWIVTQYDPTGHQKTHCKKNNVDILSLFEFRRRIIDASQYLEIRTNHPFGSASNPRNDSPDLSNVIFQTVQLEHENQNTRVTYKEIADLLNEETTVLLLGDYGMGKSFNVRMIFDSMRKRHFRTNGSTRIPVVLNLREHYGQIDCIEALQRHAERIGFQHSHQLIRAFNAGRLCIILDGFDEPRLSG